MKFNLKYTTAYETGNLIKHLFAKDDMFILDTSTKQLIQIQPEIAEEILLLIEENKHLQSSFNK